MIKMKNACNDNDIETTIPRLALEITIIDKSVSNLIFNRTKAYLKLKNACQNALEQGYTKNEILKNIPIENHKDIKQMFDW
jgi:hypothetical protein